MSGLQGTRGRLSAAGFALSAAIAGIASTPASAASEKVVWDFANADLAYPLAPLMFQNGSFYGTGSGIGGSGCGDLGCGQVFHLWQSGGTWHLKTILYLSEANGATPYAGLIPDSMGNLYGTTSQGGANKEGVAYELIELDGTWFEAILWNFPSSSGDGVEPEGGLVMDALGDLWGTTIGGGTHKLGTVFELSQSGDTWAEPVSYSFKGGSDGAIPLAGLVFDYSTDTFYGTTASGGGSAACTGGCGTVFELIFSGGKWREQVLHHFSSGTDGASPYAALVISAKGELFGTTAQGGSLNAGTVFKMTKESGSWKKYVINNFESGGAFPMAALTWGATQNTLYGTTIFGGSHGDGTVFKLTLSGSQWKESVLHSFGGGNDGGNPQAAVVLHNGNLYGTTTYGGTNGLGTVYVVTP